jgi:hypothetical protein
VTQSPQDFRDWFIMAFITVVSTAMLVYVFIHPDPEAFAAACGGLPAMIGFYHWFVLKDDKTPDVG